jgi:membrane protein
VEETRGWVKKRAIALGTMLGSVVLFLLAAVSLLAGPAIARASGLGEAGMLVWSIVQWPLAFAFMVAAFWTGYYVLPNRDQAGCKLVLLKVAAIAAAAWLVATAAFRVYIANFSSYSEAYGFLGAFIILLLWLYLTATVVLVGGELAAEMER